jgi:S-methylmethionine-dependent homocysteine/selenocysteine methylase
MKTIVLDGGMGHLLKTSGCIDVLGLPFESQFMAASVACVRTRDAVIAAHRDYLVAGCNVITTNNYTSTPYHFDKANIGLSYIDAIVVRIPNEGVLSRSVPLACIHQTITSQFQNSRISGIT